MSSDAGGRAGANDAEVLVADEVLSADPTRALRRARSAVECRRRALREIEDAPERVEAKYAKFETLLAGKEAELDEAYAMVTDAERALAEAESALAEVEG